MPSFHEKLAREAREARENGTEEPARIDRDGNLTFPEPKGRAASSLREAIETGGASMRPGDDATAEELALWESLFGDFEGVYGCEPDAPNSPLRRAGLI